MAHTIRTVLSSLAALLACAPCLLAQLDEKQAAKALKKELAAEAKSFRQAADNTAQSAVAEIQDLVAEVGSGSFTTIDLMTLDATMAAFHEDLAFEVAFTLVDAIAHVQDGLEQFTGPGAEGVADLDGLFPPGFYVGDGAALDALRKSLDATIDKAALAVEKRLAKLAKALEKEEGIGFTSAVPLPLRWLEFGFSSEGEQVVQGGEVDIAFAWAFSDLAVADDGTLCVGGLAASSQDDVSVRLTGGSGDVDLTVTTTPDTVPSWFVTISDLPEGSYLIEVSTEGESDRRHLSLGVR